MARKIKPFTAAEARAFEVATTGSKAEIARAYAAASMHGQGSVCDILLREMDRRSGDDARPDADVAFREAARIAA